MAAETRGEGHEFYGFCASCGLEADAGALICPVCGGPLETDAPLATTDVAPSDVLKPTYYRPKDQAKKGGPIYIQRGESWVAISPIGSRSRFLGVIPPSMLRRLQEVPRESAEPEVARREEKFRTMFTTRALRLRKWFHMVVLALPGLPVSAAYFLAIAWYWDALPTASVDVTALFIVISVSVMVGAIVAALLWTPTAGGNEWEIGAIFGAVVAFPAYAGVDWLAWIPGTGILILLLVPAIVLGLLGGIVAQVVSGRLRRVRADGRVSAFQPWHVAVGLGALGLFLAVWSGVSFYT